MGLVTIILRHVQRRILDDRMSTTAFGERMVHKRCYPLERASPSVRHPLLEGVDKRRRLVAAWQKEYFDHRENFDASSVLRKEFREKFAVPRFLFDRIMASTLASKRWHDSNDCSKRGPRPLPLHMKVLSILRILTLGAGHDVAEEGSGIAEETVNKMFHAWVPGTGSIKKN